MLLCYPLLVRGNHFPMKIGEKIGSKEKYAKLTNHRLMHRILVTIDIFASISSFVSDGMEIVDGSDCSAKNLLDELKWHKFTAPNSLYFIMFTRFAVSLPSHILHSYITSYSHATKTCECDRCGSEGGTSSRNKGAATLPIASY